MKTAQLRELNKADLERKLDELRRELVALRIQRANQQLKNPLKLRVTRRAIARILTIMAEPSFVKTSEGKGEKLI